VKSSGDPEGNTSYLGLDVHQLS